MGSGPAWCYATGVEIARQIVDGATSCRAVVWFSVTGVGTSRWR
jgi:hypothetical protein